MEELNPENLFYNLKDSKGISSKYNSAVFLDRDGVLIKEKNYLKDPKEIEFIPGSVKAIKKLNLLKVFIAIVTNQAGIAKGLINLDDAYQVNEKLFSMLNENGVYINCLMFCPYHPEGTVPEFSRTSEFRKSDIGMFKFVSDFYKLKPKKLFVIGDKYSDILFGKNIHAKSYLVKTGYGVQFSNRVKAEFSDVKIVENLLEAVECIIKALNEGERDSP